PVRTVTTCLNPVDLLRLFLHDTDGPMRRQHRSPGQPGQVSRGAPRFARIRRQPPAFDWASTHQGVVEPFEQTVRYWDAMETNRSPSMRWRTEGLVYDHLLGRVSK